MSDVRESDFAPSAQPPTDPERLLQWALKIREMFLAQDSVIQDLEHQLRLAQARLKKTKRMA